MPSSETAPKFAIPSRQFVAVEHPMIMKNVDKGLKTFGCAGLSKQILNSRDFENCIPLYLRPTDRTCAPILSHNASCTNVLLKITVPKRTGRKRKRGSQDPYTEDPNDGVSMSVEMDLPKGQSPELQSHARLDNPRKILRILKDNIGKYYIEPIGSIEATHRYRGLADFHQSTTHQNFMTQFRETILTGELDKVKQFKLNPSKGPVPNEEIIPPPSFTDKIIPFNWGYHQNPTVKVVTDPTTGKVTLINMSAPNRIMTQYIRHDIETVPSDPPLPPPDDPILASLIAELRKALEERPIWTRRALQNRISDVPGMYLMKPAIQYVGYQFRGGPWRDSIIKWGVDPRKDAKYRFYQTMFFKIYNRPHDRQPGDPWHDIRSEYTRTANRHTLSRDSHIFDGKSISLDGKVWQVCDITDPLIKSISLTEKLRETCDIESDGWFCNGTWAKMKGIMKTKIAGIRVGREIKDGEFAPALAFPDTVEVATLRKKLTVPLPDWRLDIDEVNEMIKRGIMTSITDSGLRKRRMKGKTYKKRLNGKRRKKSLWRTGPKQKISRRGISSGKQNGQGVGGGAGEGAEEGSVGESGEDAQESLIDPRLLGVAGGLAETSHLSENNEVQGFDDANTSEDEADESEEEEGDDDGISDIVDDDEDADMSEDDDDDISDIVDDDDADMSEEEDGISDITDDGDADIKGGDDHGDEEKGDYTDEEKGDDVGDEEEEGDDADDEEEGEGDYDDNDAGEGEGEMEDEYSSMDEVDCVIYPPHLNVS